MTNVIFVKHNFIAKRQQSSFNNGKKKLKKPVCSNPKTITVVQVEAQNYQWANESVTGDLLVIYYRDDEQIKVLL